MADEQDLAAQAVAFVKKHQKELVHEVLGSAPVSTDQPVAVFMAGIPGAGKTEVAKSLLGLFEHEPIRIDADELRAFIPGYTGTNSSVVQSAASIAVDKVLDAVYAKHLPFILDATFAVGKATMNIKRALRKGYETQIYFVYQDPAQAWQFTKVREHKEGRKVPKEAFIHAYFGSRENVRKVKEEFGKAVTLRLIIRNFATGKYEVHDNIDDIDKHLPKLYNEDELKGMLNG